MQRQEYVSISIKNKTQLAWSLEREILRMEETFPFQYLLNSYIWPSFTSNYTTNSFTSSRFILLVNNFPLL